MRASLTPTRIGQFLNIGRQRIAGDSAEHEKQFATIERRGIKRGPSHRNEGIAREVEEGRDRSARPTGARRIGGEISDFQSPIGQIKFCLKARRRIEIHDQGAKGAARFRKFLIAISRRKQSRFVGIEVRLGAIPIGQAKRLPIER